MKRPKIVNLQKKGVPEIGVPPNHPFFMVFSIITHPAMGGTSIDGKPHIMFGG